MRTKALLIGGIAAATVLAGGWALAQTQGHDHGSIGAGQHAQHRGPHAMDHGHMQGKMQHMGHGMGQGKHQATHQGGTTQLPTPQTGGKKGSAHQH